MWCWISIALIVVLVSVGLPACGYGGESGGGGIVPPVSMVGMRGEDASTRST